MSSRSTMVSKSVSLSGQPRFSGGPLSSGHSSIDVDQAVVVRVGAPALEDAVDLLLLARDQRLPGQAAHEPERGHAEVARGPEAGAERERHAELGLPADREQPLGRDVLGRVRELRRHVLEDLEARVAVDLADERDAQALDHVQLGGHAERRHVAEQHARELALGPEPHACVDADQRAGEHAAEVEPVVGDQRDAAGDHAVARERQRIAGGQVEVRGDGHARPGGIAAVAVEERQGHAARHPHVAHHRRAHLTLGAELEQVVRGLPGNERHGQPEIGPVEEADAGQPGDLHARRHGLDGLSGVYREQHQRVEAHVEEHTQRGREVADDLGLLHHQEVARRGRGAKELDVEAAGLDRLLLGPGRARAGEQARQHGRDRARGCHAPHTLAPRRRRVLRSASTAASSARAMAQGEAGAPRPMRLSQPAARGRARTARRSAWARPRTAWCPRRPARSARCPGSQRCSCTTSCR